MLVYVKLQLVFILMALTVSVTAQAQSSICRHIFVVDGKLDLGNNEKKLICGDSGGPDAWKEIPLAQAELELKNLLANLGYLNPVFTKVGANQLEITMGPKTEIKKFEIQTKDKPLLNSRKKRKIIGHPMVSSKLNEIEDWARLEVESRGYPCSSQNLQAFPATGYVILNLELNGREKFGTDFVTKVKGVDTRVLNRHLAFGADSWFDIRKIQISVNRMLSSGLFQSAFFVEDCGDENFKVKLEASVGKPNIFRFGIGASTEEFPFTNITYRNTNIGLKASSYTLSLNYSPRLKSLNFDSELFILPNLWQSYFSPRFRLAQESEDAYETNSARLGIDVATMFDSKHLRITGRVGPSLNATQTVRGEGPGNLNYAAVEASMQFTSHVYEYNLRDQNEGWQLGLSFKGQRPELGSNLGLNTYRLNFKKLWNINDLWPPLLVLGTRIDAVAVDINDPSEANLQRIPFEDRVFLGGDNSLRGFSRLSIDNDGLGYLSSTYVGFELRLVESLPYKVQPFLIYDLAFLGRNSFQFDAATLSSEGLGVRWVSPFGTLRGSAAKGRVISARSPADQHVEEFVYFLSFGQEF